MSYSTPDELMMSFSHWGMFPISLRVWHEAELERNPLFDIPMVETASKTYQWVRGEKFIDWDKTFREIFNNRTGEKRFD